MFCSSGVELLPVRKTGNKKGGSIFMDSVAILAVNVHKQLAVSFFPHPHCILFIFAFTRGGGALCSI